MKKILASMLSIALLASSFVVSFAEDTNPYGEVTSVVELSKETYETVMADYEGDTLAVGETAYEISISLKNLPDLMRGGATGTSNGVRLGNSSISLVVDKPENVRYALQMDLAMEDDFGLAADKFGLMEYSSTMSELDGAIVTLFQPGSTASKCFPSKNGQDALDVDGVLEDAFVLYVVTSGPVNITSVKSNITIVRNGDMVNGVLTKDTKTVNVPIGEAAPPTPSTPDAVKFYAVLPACEKAEASAVAQFQFDSNADGVADKGYNYDLGSLTWDTDVTVGVQVEEIDDGVTLALTNVLWK